jgi:hypothetical protein
MGSFHLSQHRYRRPQFLFYTAAVIYILTACGVPTAAVAALAGDQNKDPELCQGVAGAAYALNVALSIAAPPPLDQAGDVLAYVANLNLKLCQPQIEAPVDIYGVEPNTADKCGHNFAQRTTRAEYQNILGAPIPLMYPSNWGDLGTPKTYHFNTDVDVRLLGYEKSGGSVHLPVGRNTLVWRGDTTVSIMDFVPFHIPKLPSGSKAEKEVVKASPALTKVAEEGFKAYAKQVGKRAGEFVVEEGIAYGLDQVIGISFHHSQLGIFDDIYNTDAQAVWVYDRIAPKISTNTDNNSLDANTAAILHYDGSTGTYTIEAFQPGGVTAGSAIGVAQNLLSYSDSCDTHLSLSHSNVPDLWSVGDEVDVTWTVSDPGPVHAPAVVNGVPQDDGGHNTAQVTQRFKVQDTHPPILLAPPSKVIEVPTGVTQTDVPLGSPRVFDLVDLDSSVSNNHPGTSFDLGLSEVTWTASDDSGNASTAVQLINVKEQGTNSVPKAQSLTVAATAFKPVDITLRASDADYHPSVNRYDPLTFSIVDPPKNGFFVAPLLPFFIDDYRLEASQFKYQDEPDQADPKQYCDDLGHSQNAWELKYPYEPSWMTVDDQGNTFVIDLGEAACLPGGDFEARGRMAAFGPDGTLLRTRSSSDEQDIYVDSASGLLFVLKVTGVAYEGTVDVFDKDADNFGVAPFTTPRNLDLRDSTWGVAAPAAIAQDHQGVMYVMDRGGAITAYKVDWSDQSAKYVAQDVFLARIPGSYGYPNIYDMAVDSHNNLYIEDYNHIAKLGAASFDQDGNFIAPQFIGWMGKCTANKTDTVACDVKQQRSIGFSCTDALCEAPVPSSGDKPGQFNLPEAIAVDPNDILYVGDTGNDRVQRFTPDGYFAGQAKSTGQGYGFILGDFDRVDNITVNSNHFYILQRKDPLGGNSGLLHVFQTTPITPIDDASAKVTYQSNNNFQGTDNFVFAASDGLDSGQATVTINVQRDYRPPTVPHPPGNQTLKEDGSVVITLTGSDPDGVLDVLSYEIVTPPGHGDAKIVGDQLTYTPAPNYAGDDQFSYRVYDGKYYSDPATVALTVTSVPDKPQVTLDAPDHAGTGFNMQLNVTVFDPDAGADHRISIDWGDGATEQDGEILVDGEPASGPILNPDGTVPDNVDTTGPIYTMGSNGYGNLSAQHAYKHAGNYDINVCATDKGPIPQEVTYTEASKGCGQTSVSVIPAVAYRLTAETSAADVDPGDTVSFTFSLENRAFDVMPDDLSTGLTDTDVVITGDVSPGLAGLRLQGQASPVAVADLGSLDNTCVITGGSYRCALGTLPYDSKGAIHLVADVNALAPGNALLSLSAQVSGTAPVHEQASGAAQINVIAGNTPPALLSVTPNKGDTEIGTQVTLTGSDFQAGAVVYFGNALGLLAETKDSQTIAVLAPAHDAGPVDITVTNPDGQNAALAKAFTYQTASAGGVKTSGSGGGGGGGGGNLGLLTLGLLVTVAYVRRRTLGR